MSTNFPASLDSLTNPTSLSNQSVLSHSGQHANGNDAIEAMQVSIGITGSTDTESLRYMQERFTAKGDILTSNGTALTKLPVGTNGYILAVDNTSATGLNYIAPTSGGTVTSVAVTPANGLTGSVANPTTTPAITLGTTITGILKGNGTAVSAGTAGVDYLTPLTALPPGSVQDYAGSSAPTGWLLCDGTAVSRATYSALFAITGVSYGAGNGTTTFNLPDARGRVSVGVDGGTFAGLGTTGGEQTHVLTVGEMAQHNHGLATATSGGTFYAHVNSQNSDGTGGWNANTNVDNLNYEKVTAVNGSGTAHNNLQPYLTFNKIIKY